MVEHIKCVEGELVGKCKSMHGFDAFLVLSGNKVHAIPGYIQIKRLMRLVDLYEMVRITYTGWDNGMHQFKVEVDGGGRYEL